VFALVLVSAGCDWAQVGFDAAHTSFNPYEPALTTSSIQHLTEAWTANAYGKVVADGVIYGTKPGPGRFGRPTTMQAFNVSSGALLWSNPRDGDPIAVGNGLIYACCTVALDAKTGVQKWGLLNQWFLTLDGSRLFVLGGDSASQLSAIDPSGKPIWPVPAQTFGPVVGAVAQGGNLVVVTFTALDNAPYGLLVVSTYAGNTGGLLRRVTTPAQDSLGRVNQPLGGGPWLAASADTLYLATGVNADRDDVFAINPGNGAVLWRSEYGRGVVVYGLAVTPRAVIVTTAGPAPFTGQVIAYNPTTGAPLWTRDVADTPAVPVVAGNLVFVGAAGGAVYDLNTGALITNIPAVTGMPIVSEGHVFSFGSHALLQAMTPSP
jgi:outer membrane protein assembly factor BamB